MRLKRLDLTRYGKFTDGVLSFGNAVPGRPDLHVVYGLNEAGKSTALSAYLDLLFGIEERSRYGFLHPYATMQVGALLEFAGAEHELVRRKQRSGSLSDAQGRQVGEGVLSGALSGLTREAYRAMFSLDDDTLEKGGDAILQSRGELGELLFSASSGLSEVSAVLSAMSDQANGIYRKQARNTEIAQLKASLKDLKEKRDAIDTAATTHAALQAEFQRAAAAYDLVMRERAELRIQLDAAERLARAHPLGLERRRLERELERYSALPRPPRSWAGELPELIAADSRLSTQAESIGGEIERLRRDVDAIRVDERVVAVSPEIRALVDDAGGIRSADEQMPRRREALAGHEATLVHVVRKLGRGKDRDPATLVLPTAVTGKLRELIETKSGIDADLRNAIRELAAATESLASAREALDAIRGDGLPDAEAVAALGAILSRLRRSEAAAGLRHAEGEAAKLELRVSEALAALAPWTGDATTLRALVLPQPQLLETWRSRSAAIRNSRGHQKEQKRDLEGRIEEGRTLLDAMRTAAGPIGDEIVREAWDERELAWKRHVDTLDQRSASTFRQTMEAVDRIVERRLEGAQHLADLRSRSAAHEIDLGAMRRAEASLLEIDRDEQALEREMSEAVGVDIGNPPGAPIDARLDRLAEWCRRRDAALAASASLADARLVLAEKKSEGEALGRELTDAFARCGRELTATSLNGLIEQADTYFQAVNNQFSSRSAAEARLGECERDHVARMLERDGAAVATNAWKASWEKTLAATWMDRDAGVGFVRETLAVLDDLPATLRSRDDMRHRIEAMEDDRLAFAARVAAVAEPLGVWRESVSPTEVVKALAEDLNAAEQARKALAAKSAELAEARDRHVDIERALRVHGLRASEMTAFFGKSSLAEVSAACEECAARDRIEARLSEQGEALMAELRTGSADEAMAALEASDADAVTAKHAELAARWEDLDERRQVLFAERGRSEDRLGAIGGDDAAARLHAERQTVVLQVEGAAVAYLRLRAGAMLAQEALRLYRDRHQSSMMARASRAFAAVTRGSYSGLSSRPQAERDELIGLSREGGSKLAVDMSKGTRFQLYLALRMAGYEEFAAGREPVPFVADDVMETFDEPRSTEVLRLLGAMSRVGQVIYLTHHRHICELAVQVEPGARVHAL